MFWIWKNLNKMKPLPTLAPETVVLILAETSKSNEFCSAVDVNILVPTWLPGWISLPAAKFTFSRSSLEICCVSIWTPKFDVLLTEAMTGKVFLGGYNSPCSHVCTETKNNIRGRENQLANQRLNCEIQGFRFV